MSRIFLSPPDVGARERELLLAAFDSNWVAPAGPDLALFERAIADECGRAHAVALASGTAAIHLGLLLSGVGAGDDVIVSSFTFIGSVNPIVQLGARPVLIDSSADTWNLDPELVDTELGRRAVAGEAMPAVVVAVDLYGQCADYVALGEVCSRYGVTLVSDAAEALGAAAFGRPAGSFGPWAAMSFNGNKIITTGGGGAFLTDDAALAERVRTLATQARLPVAHYEHAESGFNYRLSNLLAAVGRGQVEGLAAKVARRSEIQRTYREAFAGVAGLSWQPVPEWSEPNRWLTCVVLDEAVHGVGRCEEIRVALEAHDIETRPLWKPMHLQPVFRDVPSVTTGVSERLFRTGLCLPSGSGMSAAELERVCSAVGPLVAERGWRSAVVGYRSMKRMIDVAIAGAGLVVLTPVLAVVAVVVRMRIGSPVLFRQQRPGLGGREFTILKFRTMSDARDASGVLLSDAQRLTSVGRALRATSLDELPELWNVLVGDMSLVGPRPLLVQYLGRYTPEQARRHEVRPGVTGLAQVSGRNAVSWDDRFRLDVAYVDTMSLRGDLRILWRTMSSVARREGISAEGDATMPEFTGARYPETYRT